MIAISKTRTVIRMPAAGRRKTAIVAVACRFAAIAYFLCAAHPANAESAEASPPGTSASAASHAPSASENASSARRQTVVRRRMGIDARVDLLSRELNLDGAQRTEVRKILVAQRQQVMQLWNDPSVPAERRVSATRQLSDQTAQRIRAVLNEEQRKQYVKQRDPARPAPKVDVESWMKPQSATMTAPGKP